jgi:hypothetical protein
MSGNNARELLKIEIGLWLLTEVLLLSLKAGTVATCFHIVVKFC